MNLRAELVDELAALERYTRDWDDLAVAADRPYCAPAWMLSWWRHAAPRDAGLRAVLALDGDTLVGIAPFFVGRAFPGIAQYQLLASPAAGRIEPLAREGLEEECAVAFTSRLAQAKPRPSAIRFDGVPRGSAWPDLFRTTWPGRASIPVLLRETIPAPTITYGERGFDEYFASRSSKFRAELRRHRRQIEGQGAKYRLAASPAELERDLGTFARLHYSRWEERGGSDALDGHMEEMLQAVGRELLPAGRLRAFTIDAGGSTVSVQLFVAAGGELAYWLGGFDDDWAAYGPGNLAVLSAVEDSLGRGERRLDLGPGGQPYKYRFADGEDTLEWLTLVPRRTHYPIVRAFHALRRLRNALSSRVPEVITRHIRRIRRA